MDKEPKPFEPIKGFDDKLNNAVEESEILGGAWLDKLNIGKSLRVATEHTNYLIEKREDGYYISGNPKFCPEPTKVTISGSTFGGHMIKVGFVGRGMHLEFTLPDGKTTTTSEIKDVKELE